jgi:HD-like signal output (HDOD) protein
VTATLFHKWNLDADIIHTIRYSDDPEGTVEEEREMAAELKAVRETILPNGEITKASIATAKETIEEFGLDLESYEKALEKVLS